MKTPDPRPFSRVTPRWLASETTVFTVSSVLVGLSTGMATIGFVTLIRLLERWAATLRLMLAGISPFVTILIPALGGLGAGLLITHVAEEMRYGGIPAILEANALRGSRLRGRLVWAKLLATALCIGTGGSAGRVGPIAQIGAALGSQIGQRFHLTDERIRNLVACGAAAGIASTFNAPIAGVIFALEVIQGELTETFFSTILISAVTSSIVSRSVLGADVAFTVPAYALEQPLELAFCAVLGGLAALVAWSFITTFYATKDITARLRPLPDPLRPALGGLLLGVLALAVPQVLGGGFAQISQALRGQLALPLMAALVLAKLLATDLTLGSGSSGGLFAPALFMGAMLGGAFGEALHLLLAGSPLGQALAPSGAYALVGMAAVFGAAAHAPMTALLIVFEMSGSYSMILPLMLATGIGTVVARALQRESIYTLSLARKGIPWQRGQEMDVLQNVRVDNVMTTEPVTVLKTTSLQQLASLIDQTRHRGFPVLDANGRLAGVVSLSDLEAVKAQRQEWTAQTVASIYSPDVIAAYPDESVSIALQRMGVYDVSRLPVISRDVPRHLVGMIHRSDIGAAYQHALVQSDSTRQLWLRRRTPVPLADNAVDLTVGPSAPAAGQPIRALAWPPNSWIVSIHRGEEVLVGRGDLVLQSGDRLTIYAHEEAISELEALVCSPGNDPDSDVS
ncbi:MAG: chloride channel protein [Anaerolineae bacterium]|nr:chloride channel protein [Anaerolineae bacterium]